LKRGIADFVIWSIYGFCLEAVIIYYDVAEGERRGREKIRPNGFSLSKALSLSLNLYVFSPHSIIYSSWGVC